MPEPRTLTPLQAETLRHLRRAGVLTARDLSRQLQLHRDTARSRLNSLADAGVARRIPSLERMAGVRGFYWYEAL